MIQQVVKGLEGTGAHHLEHQEAIALTPLAQHVHHHRYGIVMMRQAVKVLLDIGVNRLLLHTLLPHQLDGVLNHHVQHIHAINHRSIIVMTNLHVKGLGVTGAYHNMGEVVGARPHHVLYQEGIVGIKYVAEVRPRHHARMIVG